MELKVDKTIETTNSDGETEQKAVLKGEDGTDKYTLTIVGAGVLSAYRPGDPYEFALDPLQTKLTDLPGEEKK